MTTRDKTDKLVHSAIAGGRILRVITYYDGQTPVEARLVFNTSEEAAEAARVLTEAKVPELSESTKRALRVS